MLFRACLILAVTLTVALPAHAALPDTIINKPRALVLINSMGRANVMLAGMGISIHRLQNLPEGRRVRLTGTVENRSGTRLFILRDATGSVEVMTDQPLPENVKDGFDVTVAGRVRRSLFGTDIKATSVKSLQIVEEVVIREAPKPHRLASAE